MRWIAVPLALVAGACFQPRPIEGAACNSAMECPSPLSCHGGVCTSMPSDRDAAIDMPVVPACDPIESLGNFPAPTVLASISTVDGEGTPSLTEDLLELYMKSSRAGGKGAFDIWRSTRTSTSAPWTTPQAVAELNTANDDVGVEVSADGLTLWMSSDRPGGKGGLDIYVSTRPSRQSAWTGPSHVAALSTPGTDEGISVSKSQRIAYLHTAQGSSIVIVRAQRGSPNAPWSEPEPVTELNVSGYDGNPWVSPDDCAIYFQSTRMGGPGYSDLWMARRPRPDLPFGTPAVLAGVNNGSYDADPWLTPDQRVLVYASYRDEVGYFDLYQATR